MLTDTWDIIGRNQTWDDEEFGLGKLPHSLEKKDLIIPEFAGRNFVGVLNGNGVKLLVLGEEFHIEFENPVRMGSGEYNTVAVFDSVGEPVFFYNREFNLNEQPERDPAELADIMSVWNE